MQSLRNAALLARLVLAWFALSLGVAVASPVIQPQAVELVCSSTGVVKLLVKSGSGTGEVRAHAHDCPLCVTAGTPPPAVRSHAEPAQPLADVRPEACAIFIAWRPAAPLPARGPPSA
jgi:hypothetical protein